MYSSGGVHCVLIPLGSWAHMVSYLPGGKWEGDSIHSAWALPAPQLHQQHWDALRGRGGAPVPAQRYTDETIDITVCDMDCLSTCSPPSLDVEAVTDPCLVYSVWNHNKMAANHLKCPQHVSDVQLAQDFCFLRLLHRQNKPLTNSTMGLFMK
jgi:hypothetical protein